MKRTRKWSFVAQEATRLADIGVSALEIARRLGVKLPHLCYTPKPGYRPDGNCRVCMVEIEGERVLAMVKDEDVCLHCGLCAERCPTGAWDMQKFFLETAKTTNGAQACLSR